MLVDGSKLGRVDVALVCAVDGLDLAGTGASAPASELEALREAGVEVLIAPKVREEGTEFGRVAVPRLQFLEENP